MSLKINITLLYNIRNCYLQRHTDNFVIHVLYKAIGYSDSLPKF